MCALLDPGDDLSATDVLEDALAINGISLPRLASAIGRNSSQLYQISAGKAPISAPYAHAVAQHFGLDALVLLARQARSNVADVAARATPRTRVRCPAPALIPRHAGGELDDEASAVDLLAAVAADARISRMHFALSLGYHRSMMYKVLGDHRTISVELAHAVAQRYGIDPVDLLVRQDRQWLNENTGSQAPDSRPPRPSLPPIPRLAEGELDEDTIVRRYVYGYSSFALGDAAGVSSSTVLRILHARNLTRGPFSHPREAPQNPAADITRVSRPFGTLDTGRPASPRLPVLTAPQRCDVATSGENTRWTGG